MRFTPSFRKVYCNGVAQSCNSRLWLTLTPTITNKWNSAECKDIPVLVPANLSSFEATFHSPLESRSLAAFSRSSRSEEHTSELQSRLHLVCRLLLEKKKNEYIHTLTNNMHIDTYV